MIDPTIVDIKEYRAIKDNLNALEQAIEEICDVETVHTIQKRKKGILKKRTTLKEEGIKW